MKVQLTTSVTPTQSHTHKHTHNRYKRLYCFAQTCNRGGSAGIEALRDAFQWSSRTEDRLTLAVRLLEETHQLSQVLISLVHFIHLSHSPNIAMNDYPQVHLLTRAHATNSNIAITNAYQPSLYVNNNLQ